MYTSAKGSVARRPTSTLAKTFVAHELTSTFLIQLCDLPDLKIESEDVSAEESRVAVVYDGGGVAQLTLFLDFYS